MEATRQRRKLTGDKAKNSEKYLLASARVTVDFKLRRAKGCKVSKLWLKKKMKSYIEECYGKEEASKFKGSQNWFRRDLRNGMVFHSGEEQTRKNRQLMMGDKQSRNFTVT